MSAEPVNLKIIRLDQTMPMPAYAHADDGGFDLYAAKNITINVGERISIPTGLKMEIPTGYVGFIWDKSGLSHKHGLKTFGGVVDAGYRGEVMVGMMNLGTQPYTFEKNHKVAQMTIQRREDVVIEEVQSDADFSDSTRGEGGFGSTGK
jgi:dUTP pyrophosphatase